MPYPESCPECGGTFRNTGTHFTARRNEVGRHVLLELGCQNTAHRFWWNFTTGRLTEDGRASRSPTVTVGQQATTNGTHPEAAVSLNGHDHGVATLEPPAASPAPPTRNNTHAATPAPIAAETEPAPPAPVAPAPTPPAPPAAEPPAPAPLAAEAARSAEPRAAAQVITSDVTNVLPAAIAASDDDVEGAPAALSAPTSLKEAFVRQLQLDRLTLRQMRSLLMSDEARRAIEVAAGATEATYERLALILFGSDLLQLLGKPAAAPASAGMSAEDRLELQREKARVRARLRRAAIKAARTSAD